MANVQALLESADSDLLVAVVDVILFIAKVYPHIFSAHFRVGSFNQFCMFLLICDNGIVRLKVSEVV